MNNTVRSALLLPGLVAASSLVPATFGIADPEGIWSLETNPAGLGRMGGWELGAQSGGQQTQSEDAVLAGRNGFAVGWDRLPGPVVPTARETDVRLGLGGHLGRGIYAGLSAVRHAEGGTKNGWSSDLGLLWQPDPRFSLGLVMPNLRGRDISRSTGSVVGLAVRPTGALDLQVGMEAWLSGAVWLRPSWDKPVYDATVRIRPLPWLTLDGRADPAHPGQWGAGVAVQVAPNFRLFARSAPAPEGSEFQSFGAHFVQQTRPAAAVASPVVLYKVPGDLSESSSGWGASPGLRKLRDDFRQIASVRGVDAVILDLGSTRYGPLAAGELRRQILSLRSRGVAVWAWARDLDMGTIGILAAADHAAIDPDGMVRARGLAMDMPYFGKALRRHGVQVQVVKTGPWKSAMEPFESDRMSPEAREDLQRFLMDLDSSILAGVVTGRKVDPARLVAYVDSGSALPRSALAAGLVDTLLEQADLSKWARASQRGILHLPLAGELREEWGDGKRVVVVYLEGQVVDHSGEPGMLPWGKVLAADRAAAILDRLKDDSRVGAVVLRVNSPGGAVSGSERLRRAVERLSAKKPVAASIAGVAASGSYLFSLPAGRIYSEPEAMVGSIGAFAAKVNVAGLMDSLGIRVERIKTAPHAGALSPFAPFDSLELARVSEFVEDAHKGFADQVKRFRKYDSAAFLKVDGGRIFTGARAVDVGLVDSVGGIEAAIRWASSKSHVDFSPRVEWIEPGRRSFFVSMGVAARALSGSLEERSAFDQAKDVLSRPSAGVWAQMPWEPFWE